MSECNHWCKTAFQLPPNKTTCRVITDSGDERTLIYADKRWWLPDMSTYVSFVPVFWRKEQEQV